MRLGFLNRLRNGYGNIYTPHAGSMIIQVQRETGLANRTIVISERQVALVRIVRFSRRTRCRCSVCCNVVAVRRAERACAGPRRAYRGARTRQSTNRLIAGRTVTNARTL